MKPNYGIDAPAYIKKFGGYGILGLIFSLTLCYLLPNNWWAYLITGVSFAGTFFCLGPVITIWLGSVKFKFRDRDWLFDELKLTGEEIVLDVGCGHGLLLIGAAKRLSAGKAVGIDLWAQEDQASNSKEATLKNAKIEGVESKIEIHSGDMRKMTFPDASFDAIVSSWAIHNIYDKPGREQALNEILRVLKKNGKIAILDIDNAPEYADFFKSKGLNSSLLGPRYTFGNPTYLVMATKN